MAQMVVRQAATSRQQQPGPRVHSPIFLDQLLSEIAGASGLMQAPGGKPGGATATAPAAASAKRPFQQGISSSGAMSFPMADVANQSASIRHIITSSLPAAPAASGRSSFTQLLASAPHQHQLPPPLLYLSSDGSAGIRGGPLLAPPDGGGGSATWPSVEPDSSITGIADMDTSWDGPSAPNQLPCHLSLSGADMALSSGCFDDNDAAAAEDWRQVAAACGAAPVLSASDISTASAAMITDEEHLALEPSSLDWQAWINGGDDADEAGVDDGGPHHRDGVDTSAAAAAAAQRLRPTSHSSNADVDLGGVDLGGAASGEASTGGAGSSSKSCPTCKEEGGQSQPASKAAPSSTTSSTSSSSSSRKRGSRSRGETRETSKKRKAAAEVAGLSFEGGRALEDQKQQQQKRKQAQRQEESKRQPGKRRQDLPVAEVQVATPEVTAWPLKKIAAPAPLTGALKLTDTRLENMPPGGPAATSDISRAHQQQQHQHQQKQKQQQVAEQQQQQQEESAACQKVAPTQAPVQIIKADSGSGLGSSPTTPAAIAAAPAPAVADIMGGPSTVHTGELGHMTPVKSSPPVTARSSSLMSNLVPPSEEKAPGGTMQEPVAGSSAAPVSFPAAPPPPGPAPGAAAAGLGGAGAANADAEVAAGRGLDVKLALTSVDLVLACLRERNKMFLPSLERVKSVPAITISAAQAATSNKEATAGGSGSGGAATWTPQELREMLLKWTVAFGGFSTESVDYLMSASDEQLGLSLSRQHSV